MNPLGSAVKLVIAGSALVMMGHSSVAIAQDPRKPQLPEHSDAPASDGSNDRDKDRAKVVEARREIEILEARIAVKRAEIEEVMARVHLRTHARSFRPPSPTRRSTDSPGKT